MGLQGDVRIGELAELAGCSTSAVRYYEREGLLDAPERVSGQRRYRLQAVERLRLILVLRRAGLGIRDLAVALDHAPEGAEARRSAARQRAEALRAQLQDSLRALAILDHGADCTSTATDDGACAADIERRLDEAGVARLTPPRVGEHVRLGGTRVVPASRAGVAVAGKQRGLDGAAAH